MPDNEIEYLWENYMDSLGLADHIQGLVLIITNNNMHVFYNEDQESYPWEWMNQSILCKFSVSQRANKFQLNQVENGIHVQIQDSGDKRQCGFIEKTFEKELYLTFSVVSENYCDIQLTDLLMYPNSEV